MICFLPLDNGRKQCFPEILSFIFFNPWLKNSG